jgi:hypothetical protein
VGGGGLPDWISGSMAMGAERLVPIGERGAPNSISGLCGSSHGDG